MLLPNKHYNYCTYKAEITLPKTNIDIAPKNGGFQFRNLLFQGAPDFQG